MHSSSELTALRAQLAKSHQELRLWKLQLELAQKEILRAQTVVDQVDRARVDAEERAHRYRQQLRQLLEERSVQDAIDQGRRIGFQEGLELGRRSLMPLRRTSAPAPISAPVPTRTPVPPAPAPPVPPPTTTPVPPVPTTTPAPPAPSRTPAPIPDPHPTRPPEVIHPRPPVPPTFQAPPDNYIPVVPQGKSGIALPPPHEWDSRPRSDSQGTNTTRRASIKSGRAATLRSPLPPPVASSAYQPSQPPRTKTPSVVSHHSRSSSRISQFDLVGPPPSESSKKAASTLRMTQPERIADEWRSQNPDMLTPPKDQDVIPRPMSSDPFNHPRPAPPQRPTTTDPTRPRPARSQTPKSTRTIKSPRQVALPTPASNLFYSPPTSTPPQGDWLRTQFANQRTASGLSVVPNIDVESPSEKDNASPAVTEKSTVVVDPTLLSTADTTLPTTEPRDHPKDPVGRVPSAAPTTSTTTSTMPGYYSYPIYSANGKPPQPPMPYIPRAPSTAPSDRPVIPGEMKILPPGFVPLSPIPALSSLDYVPENASSSGSSESTARSGRGGMRAERDYRRSEKARERERERERERDRQSADNMYYQPQQQQHYQQQQHQQVYGAQDVVVMNARGAFGPGPGVGGGGGGGGGGVSPAPLNRPLSIFDED
ncbi:hypothetical protein D9756_008776 [Leucocoprinus leucothites]|uniref:Uncharacterized protein n=1 Tax=Leucocoprinus leucothites TaxID=201217 RepID=A0A8H5CXE5_9AGAR|nr:hypothetical protein D9756_008776 [Leucoagaricus leucothites]